MVKQTKPDAIYHLGAMLCEQNPQAAVQANAMGTYHLLEAAAAMIQLGRAPVAHIKTVNYLIDGPKPPPNAEQLADIVKAKLPTAEITFAPDPQFQPLLDNLRPLDDTNARTEWGWNPTADYPAMVDDFLHELAA